MASSSHNSLFSSFKEDIDKAMDDEFESCIEECLDHYSDALEPKKAKRKRMYIEREREKGDIRLWNDYFSDKAIYPDYNFRRRFRMNKSLFMRIVQKLSTDFPYFQQKPDGMGRMSLPGLQKCTVAIRIMAYGTAADHVDEYLRIGDSTALKCFHNFVIEMIYFYEEYLRKSTPEDLRRLLKVAESRGFPSSIENIECMHWEWKNYPTAWKGQYSRDHNKPRIVLEAVASYDLWI